MKPSRFPILALAFLCSISLRGVASEALSISASAEYVSSYVFRGDKVAGASIQPNLNVSFGSVYANVWASRALHQGELNERDFTVGYTAGDHFDFGLTAFTYEDGISSSWEPYLGFSFEPIATVSTSLYAYYDWVLKTFAIEGKVSKTVSLTELFSADVALAAGNVQGSAITTYQYWSAGIVPTYQISAKLSATAGVHYRSASSSDHSRDQVVYTVGLGFEF